MPRFTLVLPRSGSTEGEERPVIASSMQHALCACVGAPEGSELRGVGGHVLARRQRMASGELLGLLVWAPETLAAGSVSTTDHPSQANASRRPGTKTLEKASALSAKGETSGRKVTTTREPEGGGAA